MENEKEKSVAVLLQFTEEEFETIWNRATAYFWREDANKAWQLPEKKEAVRYYIRRQMLSKTANN